MTTTRAASVTAKSNPSMTLSVRVSIPPTITHMPRAKFRICMVVKVML